jgi:O-antigen biosynthesis protein
MDFNPLHHPILYSAPRRQTADTPAWHEHVPFAMLGIDVLRPRVFVELGTHHGDSYCAFCQAIDELNVESRCYAIDTWEGDAHSGFYGPQVLEELRAYHDPLYGAFSSLAQSTFDAALADFDDRTIDLLHIDGCHTYEAVKHDFTAWLPKMTTHGVVLLHDTNFREDDFGVWRLWEELVEQYPAVEFVHGFGLGAVAVGESVPQDAKWLFEAQGDDLEAIRAFFAALGSRLALTNIVREQQSAVEDRDRLIADRDRRIVDQDRVIADRDRLIEEKEGEIEALAKRVASRETELALVLNSLTWRATTPARVLSRKVINGVSARFSSR